MQDHNESTVLTKFSSLAMWEGWVFGPVAWAAHQNVSYSLTYWICGEGTKWLVYLATLVALSIAASAGYLSCRFGSLPPQRSTAKASRRPHPALGSRRRWVR